MLPLSQWFPDEKTLLEFLWGENVKINILVEKGSTRFMFRQNGSMEEKLPEGAMKVSLRQFDFNLSFNFTVFIETLPNAPGSISPNHCRICVEEMHKPAQLLGYYLHNKNQQEPLYTVEDVRKLCMTRFVDGKYYYES